MDRGAWWATAWGRKESDIIELHTHTHTIHSRPNLYFFIYIGCLSSSAHWKQIHAVLFITVFLGYV